MATIQSYNTANPGNASSITVTKPTGLAVGDLMIFATTWNDATDTASQMTGWTQEVANYGGTQKIDIQYKVADSGDVAASNFTVGFSGTVGTPVAVLMRITDYVSTGLLNENKDTGANGDTTLSATVTPSYTNNLLLMIIGNNENSSLSNYAIATDNPTWSELVEVQSGSLSAISVAYATRTQTTATGDMSFNSSVATGTIDFYGVLIAIETPASTSFTLDTAGIATLSTPEPSFILDNNFSLDTAGSVTLSGGDNPVSTTTKTTWTNESKPSTTWTNES